MSSLQNTVILGVQGFLMLSENEIFDKDDQVSDIKIQQNCFAAWSYLSKFWFHEHQETLNVWNNSVL